MRQKIESYTALVVQPEVTVADTRADVRKNLDRVCNLIHFGVGYFWEVPVRLAVLPEYFLQGVGTPGKGESGIEDQMKKAVTIPGPEVEQLGEIARQYEMYICAGGVVEVLPEFPDRWFNTNFIVGPTG
ncbi:MAG: nitrilase-related carbon-nitrogen hydrolase, partial [Gammaproteobacteria bacterium]